VLKIPDTSGAKKPSAGNGIYRSAEALRHPKSNTGKHCAEHNLSILSSRQPNEFVPLAAGNSLKQLRFLRVDFDFLTETAHMDIDCARSA
jgi:hypothetical protein